MSKLSEYLGNDGFTQPENLEDDEFSLLPVGWYPVEITDVKIVDNENGSGARFVVKFTIIGDKYQNRKVWNGAGFNFIHTSQAAQAIGQRELGRLTKACGYGENDRLTDEAELIQKRLDVYVEVEPGTGEYKDRNKTTKYKPLGQGGEKTENPTTNSAPSSVTVQKSASAPAAAATPEKEEEQQSSTPLINIATPKSSGKRPWEK